MDLPKAIKNQIFQLIDSVQPKSRYKTVIIDSTVQKLFTLCLENHELLDRQVANVQLIDKPRQAETYLDGLYICEASYYNIECIAADFTRVPHRYNAAHAFFLPGATQKDIAKLQSSTAGRFIQTVDVANFYVFPYETNAFSLNDPFVNDKLYNAHAGQDTMKNLEKMAFQLSNLCEALGEYPYVRYYNSAGTYPQHDLPKLLADRLTMHLGNNRERLEDPAKPKSTILLLDRSLDPMAPFLHEFTFQAMAYDLLQIDDGNVYTSYEGDLSGRLDESDFEWVELRHLHISNVTEELGKRVTALKESNPHFADATKDVRVSDLRNMMASLPSYVKSKDRMALNLQMASEIMDAVDKQHLRLLAEIEQSAVLGPDPDSENPEPVTDQFINLLARPDIDRRNKLRLLILYVLGRRTGMYKEDYERLRLHAGFDQREIDMVNSLTAFGSIIQKKPGHHESINPLKKDKGNPTFYSENSGQQLLYARYTPGFKNVTEKLINGTLDTQQFPYCGDAPASEQDFAESSSSLRNPRQRATWAKTNTKQPAKARVIVFVIGGVTASELRGAYELSSAYPKDVVVGGSDIMTAGKMLTFLSRQRLHREQLSLPEDAPNRRPPAFLFESDRDNAKTAQQLNQNQQRTAAQQQSKPATPSKAIPTDTNMEKPEKRRFFGLRRK